jgi:hypothetical protein
MQEYSEINPPLFSVLILFFENQRVQGLLDLVE